MLIFLKKSEIVQFSYGFCITVLLMCDYIIDFLVLEAGDMTTLLEQFEASEAVNTSCKVDEQTNMNHQNIKDALPKEVIDRIKVCFVNVIYLYKNFSDS